MLNRSVQFALLFALTLLFTASGAVADFTCGSELTYKWKRGKEGLEVTSSLGRIERTAPTEPEAKAQLAEFQTRTKPKALEQCKDAHENLSGCISARYSSLGSVMSTLSFGARKSLEDAITSDCTSLQGTCADVIMGEPVCTEKVKVEEGDGKKAAEGKKEEEKGKKKK